MAHRRPSALLDDMRSLSALHGMSYVEGRKGVRRPPFMSRLASINHYGSAAGVLGERHGRGHASPAPCITSRADADTLWRRPRCKTEEHVAQPAHAGPAAPPYATSQAALAESRRRSVT